MTVLRSFVVVALGAALVTGSSSAAPSQTADEQLVAGLGAARLTAARAAGALTQISPARVARARANIQRALSALATVQAAAPRAVGALETASVKTVLLQGRALARRARATLASARYASTRAKLQRVVALARSALDDFGVPLEKEFSSYAVSRDFAYLPEFAGYSGVSATVGAEITEVVIGGANRSTANAGEPGAVTDNATGLPITRMSVAVISDPIGRFTSGWCALKVGVITCRIRPAMPTDRVFTIAFGPKLPKGTKLLVKFRSQSGDRSHALFATR